MYHFFTNFIFIRQQYYLCFTPKHKNKYICEIIIMAFGIFNLLELKRSELDNDKIYFSSPLFDEIYNT